MSDFYLDHTPFLHPNFSPHDYSAAILSGQSYDPSNPSGGGVSSDDKAKKDGAVNGKADVETALARLNFGVDEITRQLRNEITTSHAPLLLHLSTTTTLSTSLTSLTLSLSQLTLSLNRLSSKIRTPHAVLEADVKTLAELRIAGDALRRAGRFWVLARRLESFMKDVELEGDGAAEEGAMNKAALSIAELDTLLVTPPAPLLSLSSLSLISNYTPHLTQLRTTLTSVMESQIFKSLSELNQPLLGNALQTAFNLGVLKNVVKGLMQELSGGIRERIRAAIRGGRESQTVAAANAAAYKNRHTRQPTTSLTSAEQQTALWGRLEGLIEDMSECCIKVYTLEKVLRLKKDSVTGTGFLDEVVKELDNGNKPSFIFWSELAGGFGSEIREGARNSQLLQQTLSVGYPRLLRLFHEFFVKISGYTDTVYTQNQQSPETVLILRSIASFESLYLSSFLTRINEPITNSLSGGTRSPPGSKEGILVSRAIANELDGARFDPLLVRNVARGVATALDGWRVKLENLWVKDHSSVTMLGPQATASQTVNAQIVNALFAAHNNLSKVLPEYNERIVAVLQPVLDDLKASYEKVTVPLLAAIRKEFTSIISRLHRVDYSKLVDPNAGMGSASPYMKDLMEKMTYVKNEILRPFVVGEEKMEWAQALVRHILHVFVLHASIASPLGESGKLKLTSDMTELEFALGTFLALGSQNNKKYTVRLDSVGGEYKVLRAMRPLLFLDTPNLASPAHTKGLPPLIVLHHILVRSPISLPHQLHNWTEVEYVRWVEAHTEEESLKLLEKGVLEMAKSGRGDKETEALVKQVLENARANEVATS